MSVSDHDVGDLLGAYALDAVDPEDAALVEAHLATCPRCRAEVEQYRETASYLAIAGTEAPEGIWAKIGAEIAADSDRPSTSAPNLVRIGASRRSGWNRRRTLSSGIAAIAAAALIVLGVEVAHLSGQVNNLQSASRSAGLAPLVTSALEGPHESVTLTAALSTSSAAVVITKDGSAFWIGSSLAAIPGNRTYQLWGRVRGRIVSLGLLGSNPARLSMFRVQRGTTRLMVTNEPSGGTAAPTSPVVVSGTLAPSL